MYNLVYNWLTIIVYNSINILIYYINYKMEQVDKTKKKKLGRVSITLSKVLRHSAIE